MSRKNFSLLILFAALTLTRSGYSQNSGIALSSDSVEINFDMLGDGKPALVFVHGWSNDRSIWDSQVSYFSKKYKVVAVDLPGFGKSGNNRRNWTVPAFGGDVAAVIEKLDLDNVVLVGFSLGGPVVIETENKIPDRISGVVLVETQHDVESYKTPETIKLMDSIFMDLVANPTMEKLKPFFRKNKEQSFERVLAMINVPRIGWKESLNNAFLWENNNRNESLKKMHAPVISINAAQTPTNIEAFKKYVPSYKPKIIEDSGHVVMWDASEEFNRLLEESIHEFVGR
ncbi:MAG: alpha/beta fold hydrolase [Ignavibacteria bacterium]